MLGFVGRRLLAESVLLLFAVREAADERMFPGLPALTVDGLTDEDARALLTAAVPGHLDERVRDRIVAETRGNPLGLLELASGMSEAELAGGFAVPPTATVCRPVCEDHYLRRVRALPEPTRRLMLLAAADPTGDADAAVARRADVGPRTTMPRPRPTRSSCSRSAPGCGSGIPWCGRRPTRPASPEDRRAAHLALAAATDARDRSGASGVAPGRCGDRTGRRRRHRTRAGGRQGPGPRRAGGRGGVPPAVGRVDRRAGTARRPRLGRRPRHLHAGAFDAALGLLAEAEAAAVDDLQRARVEQLRGQIDWASSSGREAPVRLLQAARQLESLDVRLARETYLDACSQPSSPVSLAEPGGHFSEVARAARSVAPPATARGP